MGTPGKTAGPGVPGGRPLIFVTVGHQMPFDRLVRAVDQWAACNQRDDVFAQIGDTTFRPTHIGHRRFLSPAEFDQQMREATAIVAHAGTGTILAAAQLGKPLLVMPRLASLHETRNDHQVPTAEHFAKHGHVLAAADEHALQTLLGSIESFVPRPRVGDSASPELIGAIREFIQMRG